MSTSLNTVALQSKHIFNTLDADDLCMFVGETTSKIIFSTSTESMADYLARKFRLAGWHSSVTTNSTSTEKYVVVRFNYPT